MGALIYKGAAHVKVIVGQERGENTMKVYIFTCMNISQPKFEENLEFHIDIILCL